MNNRRADAGDYLLLVLLAFGWGSSFLAIKLAVGSVSPATITLGRMAISAGFLFLLVKRRRLALPTDAPTWWCLAGVALFGNALPFFLIAAAEEHVDSGLAAILIGATPLFTILLAHRFTADEKLSPQRLIGVGIGFLGLVALVGQDALRGLGDDIGAQALLLAAALSFAVNAVVARRMPPQPHLVSGFAVSLCATAMLFPFAVAANGADAGAPDWPAVLGIAWLGLVSTAGATIAFFALIRRAGAGFTAQGNYLVPMIAVILGVAVLDEQPTWNHLAALALILLGILVANAKSARP